ncbi:hypothetical protein [Ralstonia phage RP12]|uniref:Uncharacterized protein n=1 Tax=Ralstonia phage RP12 TaxID=1923889 RepID=A0A1L7N0J1_9CAUD|nr:hypothetical protein FDH28_gp005 [Ralstonia phage RP12]BAW18979.1 hypothetical protein [Ralstonia phage RP12]
MKILSIPEQHERYIGEYGPACEGFIDTFKKLFAKKTPEEERVEMLHKSNRQSYTSLTKDLEQDLQRTYDNPEWVTKNLADQSGMITVPALAYANVNGKALAKPRDIVYVARGMFEVVKAIVQRERPHTELRRKLVDQACKIKDNAALDKLWDANAKQLTQSPVARAQQQYKKPLPALGFDNQYPWPFNFKNLDHEEFTQFPRVETSGEVEAPAEHNAKDYAEAIRELMKICAEAMKLSEDNYIPYWDCLDSAIEYDELKNGDEIFSKLCSSQGCYEVADLAHSLEYTLGPIICGLYIAMFDKKLVARQPATEGFFDIFKSKKPQQSNEESMYKFDMQRALAHCNSFLKSPESFQLTGKSFGTDAGLILSINGHSPNPNEIARALSKTWKEATAVNDRMIKSAVQFARIVKPLIERFEKTVVAAMDRQGDLPQEVLDEAMKPLVANAQRARAANAWNTFHEESSKYDGWIGGNPGQMKQLTYGRTGIVYYDIDYSNPVPVAMPKAQSVEQLREILNAAFEFITMESGYPSLKGSLDDQTLDEDSFFEFDRPVRHLWDMMNDEQHMAINAIYAHESTSGSLYDTICQREWRVFVSIMKYVDQSIASL